MWASKEAQKHSKEAYKHMGFNRGPLAFKRGPQTAKYASEEAFKHQKMPTHICNTGPRTLFGGRDLRIEGAYLLGTDNITGKLS